MLGLLVPGLKMGGGGTVPSTLVYGPLHFAACEVFNPGAVAAEPFVPGARQIESCPLGAAAVECEA